MQYFLSFLIGYLVGSFPTAYLLVKWKSRVDIRHAGSGNVGAMNTFEVSGSTFLGVSVLIIDLLKGVLAVYAASVVMGSEFWVTGMAGLGAIFGHSYSAWLRFRGGRGLATALGVILYFGWVFVIIWIVPWAIVYLLDKDIHLANITASIIGPVILITTSDQLWRTTLPPISDSTNFQYLVIFVCLLIVVRHHDYLATLKDSITNISS
ncbi:MAG TPA: glycerol-3-phosphate acyltransferase [Bacteroidota bacterium]|jgi:glycerol-3-phosphate acyltransferase PlsY|nr:glycerol-3-phosphate acyltransferase [Bacteroidota bacterium]